MAFAPLKILILGGGPAGLYFALLQKLAHADAEITVLERNRPGDTFGWGVVFSDQTLGNLMDADPVSAHTINAAFNHWDDIEIHFKGSVTRSGGHGFIGIGRKKLLNILQDRCTELGVNLVYETDVQDVEGTIAQYQPDLVIASDGLNSRVRKLYESTFQPDIDVRKNRFVWLGTPAKYDAFTFDFQQTEHGWFQAHIYQFDDQTSTFIVETPEEVWKAHGIEDMEQQEGVAFCENLFKDILKGERLISNAAHLRGSAIWIKFPRVITQEWVHWGEYGGKRIPVVLMGDAAHTAHYSIGSGTKLAFEDAISLTKHLKAHGDDLPAALSDYVAERSVEVLKIQNAARNSTEWFENVARYAALPPEQFAYSLLTRSQRISHENLRQRDAEYLGNVETWLAEKSGLEPAPLPPMLTPYTLRGVTLKNRIVMSPMAVYSAQNGMPNDFHLVHLGARALGGAGLIFTEMTCVLPEGRITPGCAGLWNDAQRDAWARIVDFVHGQGAKIAVQLGHAGAKGSTRRAWDGTDMPLTNPAEPNWPLLSASEQQYLDGISQKSSAMTRADMDTVKQAFVDATRRAAEAGFDWLELHCAHGYLLSSFISPLTNKRGDEYGGSLENRLRYPLEVFHAIRAVWPAEKPISVRISAHDWAEGGITPDDAVQIARHFKAAGADMLDCSSGQVTKQEKPVYGRMYQTPFADRIRNEGGIPTIAVGNIFEADHVNSIITSGRADLCALARPHLSNPFWTLHEAAKLGFAEMPWPKPYWPGKQQLERNLEREKQMAAAQAGADASMARLKAELEGSV